MSLREQVYSVLIVSASEKFNTALLSLLPESDFTPIHVVSSVSLAKRKIADRSYDYVLINAPLPDDEGTRFAIDICKSKETVVLLFIRSEFYADIHSKVAKYGVHTLPKPTSKNMIIQALDWMESSRERLRSKEEKILSTNEKMLQIRDMNQAKVYLMANENMSEEDAHHYIVKQAMDTCTPKEVIAKEIIKKYKAAET